MERSGNDLKHVTDSLDRGTAAVSEFTRPQLPPLLESKNLTAIWVAHLCLGHQQHLSHIPSNPHANSRIAPPRRLGSLKHCGRGFSLLSNSQILLFTAPVQGRDLMMDFCKTDWHFQHLKGNSFLPDVA